jgi:hypothetical protein
VDVRVKTFVQQAASRLDFLHTDYGFTGPEVMHDQAGGYPLVQKVRYSGGDLAVEISLVLSYMGEEYVATTVVSGDTGPSRRTQIGTGPAHTGYQMRRPGPAGGCSAENTPRADAPGRGDYVGQF